jgi:hypothetical protein
MTWFEIVPIAFDSELGRASKLLNVPQINSRVYSASQ